LEVYFKTLVLMSHQYDCVKLKRIMFKRIEEDSLWIPPKDAEIDLIRRPELGTGLDWKKPN